MWSRLMYAVAARLGRDLDERIARLWDRTELIAPHQIPRAGRVPHVSFQMVETPHPHALELLLREPFPGAPTTIRTSALGVFARPRQVLFLSVVREPALDRYFQAINVRLMAQGYHLHPLYSPAMWTPHISLALGPFSPSTLCALLRAGTVYEELQGCWELGPLCLLGPATQSGQPATPAS
ncbi:hypothetical protein EA187_11205 [Lujinxingia sediminis]|uniref:2'-5' RNA ligase family protein n=1 Tax=Lujinxingia sediminis TaxID=2480984 RepID=A0ABY0CT30_9DELT|nr:hypothetical protein [Lujinxingia sediminis]RVU44110.1 hypothetical protein EA187_11205 [Lujinxingia sediminis]